MPRATTPETAGRVSPLPYSNQPAKGLPTATDGFCPSCRAPSTPPLTAIRLSTSSTGKTSTKILAEQAQSASGNYSDADYISIGKLANARTILVGTITKTPNGSFMLEFSVSNAEAGKRLASYGPKPCAPAALEDISAVNAAAADLLGQLGVQLTDAGKRELATAPDTQQVQAETALSKGIVAQKNGTVVEALAYYFQAVDYDPTLTEAESRLNVVNVGLSSENLGANARNEIQWRKQWVDRLTECEQFFTKYLRDPAPYNLVYSAELQPGAIDWNKETMEIDFELGFYADDKYFEILQNVVNALKDGLNETGRTERWKLNWPSESISQTTPFVGKSGNVNLSVELLNASKRVIGRIPVTLSYGYSVNPRGKTFAVYPLGGVWQSLTFKGVDANVATDPMSLRIASIDGVNANTAAQTRRISIAAAADIGAVKASSAPRVRASLPGMVWVPGGSFQMGSAGGESDEQPVHTVTLSGFYIGKYEVTQAQYSAAMGTNPSYLAGNNLPVEMVSWFDAVVFCNRLSEMESLSPAYTVSGSGDTRTVTWNQSANGYRLPTEAEWEYAARGGNGSPGNYIYAGSNTANDVAWYADNSGSTPHAVGTKAANGLGIYDMSGNVWEWCWDWYGSYPSGSQTDPAGAASGSARVARGGCWHDYVGSVRSTYRDINSPNPPSFRHRVHGFRLVRRL